MVNKKALIWSFVGVAMVITIVGIVFWFLSVETIKESYAKYIGIVGSISPVVFGVLIKIVLSVFFSKKNIKQIDKHLVESGIKPLTDIKQTNNSKAEVKDYFHFKDYHFKVGKKKIVITFNEKDEANNYTELKTALNEFIEKVRSDMSTQLI